MAADVPVLAYAAAAVPDTLGGAGVQFAPKDLEYAAELLGALAFDDDLRAGVIAGQRRRLADFGDARITRELDRRAAVDCHENRLHHSALRHRSPRRIRAPLPAASPSGSPAQHDVDVLTTCARDYVTWKNEYPEGADRIRGVTVRRFANARDPRHRARSTRYSDWIYNNPHTRADEMEWLKQQGPWCPALIEYLRRHHQQYDVLVFFTYLYAPTVLGLEVAPARSVLVPTAHDEPAIRLEIFKDVFSRPAALCYLTESERRFVQRAVPRPAAARRSRRRRRRHPAAAAVSADAGGRRRRRRGRATASADQPRRTKRRRRASFPSHLLARGAVFRRRHRLYGPIVLYGGRIDPGKGCEELIEYFSSYVKEGGDATLALMGVKLMSLPEEPFIRFAGLLSDRERLQALEAATVVVCPSPYESLSLLALEAMSVGTPVLANARSAVLVEHCVRSNGGLYYADRDEFVECLKLLVGDERLRAALGRNGRDYVRQQLPLGRRARKVRAASSRRSGTPGSVGRLTCRRTARAASSGPTTGAAPRPTRRPAAPAGSLAVRRLPLPPRPDVVALDHLVQRRRLDVQQLGGALLDAAGRFERRLDEPLLEVGDDVLERDAFRRHDELRHLEVRRLAHVIRNQLDADARPRASARRRARSRSRARARCPASRTRSADRARPASARGRAFRFSSPYFARKCCASSGMSSLRSRSGGSWIEMTCRR